MEQLEKEESYQNSVKGFEDKSDCWEGAGKLWRHLYQVKPSQQDDGEYRGRWKVFADTSQSLRGSAFDIWWYLLNDTSLLSLISGTDIKLWGFFFTP